MKNLTNVLRENVGLTIDYWEESLAFISLLHKNLEYKLDCKLLWNFMWTNLNIKSCTNLNAT